MRHHDRTCCYLRCAQGYGLSVAAAIQKTGCGGWIANRNNSSQETHAHTLYTTTLHNLAAEVPVQVAICFTLFNLHQSSHANRQTETLSQTHFLLFCWFMIPYRKNSRQCDLFSPFYIFCQCIQSIYSIMYFQPFIFWVFDLFRTKSSTSLLRGLIVLFYKLYQIYLNIIYLSDCRWSFFVI